MSEERIGLTMETRYVGNLRDALNSDLSAIKAFQRNLRNHHVIKIPVKLDLTTARAEAARVRDIVMGELGKVNASSGILGADGKRAMSAFGDMGAAAGAMSREVTTSFDKNGQAAKRFLKEIEQVGRGIEKVTRREMDVVTGRPKGQARTETLKGKTAEMLRFENELAMGSRMGAGMAAVRGKGDTYKEIELLKQQKAALDAVLKAEENLGFADSKAAIKAENQITRIGDRIETLGGRQEGREEKEKGREVSRRVQNRIAMEERRVQAQDKILTGKMAEAKLIENIADREAEVSRLMKEREALYAGSRDKFQRMDAGLQRYGRNDLADRAMRRGNVMDNQVGQTRLDAGRNIVNSTLEERKRLAAAERKAEADRIRAERAAAAKRKAEQEDILRRELQDLKAATDRRIAAIKNEERRLIAATRDKGQKALIAQAAVQQRAGVYGEAAGLGMGISDRAAAGGHAGVALSSRAQALGYGTKAAADMERMAAATAKSGHALDFHSGSMLRNAATFARWMGPAAAVMAVTGAFTAGLRSAIEVNKQYAMLSAVFRGTDEEAQKLKQGVLELSAEQGRASKEGMDAAIRWSRLGMTRNQVLEATKVSLMAANVAEMTAAESAEKLSAIYAAYKLRVGDLPVLLSRLNAMSNRYNVTNKDLFEGMVRSAGVARQLGLEIRDLEGIIASTVATGKTGAEMGTSLKSVQVRISRPETVEKMQDQFGLDLTEENGDLMKMSDILRKMAAIFPTLNRSQKAAFLDIATGTHQAARFAEVMDQYRQGQVLAAEAAFDTSSAYRENLKILDSLQSRLDSLSASWTKLFTAIGDTGIFEAAGAGLEGLGNTLSDLSSLIEQASGGIEKVTGAKDGALGNMAKNSARNMGESAGITPVYLKKMVKDAVTGDLFKSDKEEEFTDNLSRAVGKVNELRERLGGLERAAGAFDLLADAVEGGHVPMQQLTKEFESQAHLLIGLDGDTRRYTETMEKFRQMAKAGDNEGILKLLRELEKFFKADVKPTAAKLAAALEPEVKRLQAETDKLNAKKRELMKSRPDTTAGIREKDEDLAATEDRIKETATTIQQITQGIEDFKKEGLNDTEKNGWADYFRDITKAAEMAGEALASIGSDREGDPVGRVMQSQRRKIEMRMEAMREAEPKIEGGIADRRSFYERNIAWDKDAMDYSKKQEPERMSRLMQAGDKEGLTEMLKNGESPEHAQIRIEQEKTLEVYERQLAKLDEIEQMTRTRIDTEKRKNEEALRELPILEQIARVKMGISQGERQMGNILGGALVGATDTDKTINQTRAAFGAIDSRNIYSAEPLGAADVGAVYKAEETIRRNIYDLETKQYTLAASRKNLAFEQLRAEKEQTQEMSKRLQMAGREDQLRAAALSRTLRDTGDVTSSEFQFLSQSSKQAFQSYRPDAMPGDLNETKVGFAKRGQEIDMELAKIRDQLPSLRNTMKGFEDAITVARGKGGSMDIVPLEPAPNLMEKIMNMFTGGGQAMPPVNVNASGMQIKVEVSKEIREVVQTVVEAAFVKDMKEMRQWVTAMVNQGKVPTGQSVVE